MTKKEATAKTTVQLFSVGKILQRGDTAIVEADLPEIKKAAEIGLIKLAEIKAERPKKEFPKKEFPKKEVTKKEVTKKEAPEKLAPAEEETPKEEETPVEEPPKEEAPESKKKSSGKKRAECPTCGKKYYDLSKHNCPKVEESSEKDNK